MEQRVRALVVTLVVVAALGALAAVRLLSDPEPQGAGPPGTSTPPVPGEPEVVRPLEPARGPVPASVLRGLHFRDVTASVGLSGAAGGPKDPVQMAAGAAGADLDGDRDEDLLLTSSGGASGLYRNDDGDFTDITAGSGLTRLASVTVARFADVDGDGDLDLFAGGPGADFGRLFLNDGRQHFADASRQAGVVGRPDRVAKQRVVRGADFGDVDLDGDLDLVVTDWNPGLVVAADAAGARADLFPDQCQFAARTRLVWSRQELPATGDSRLFLNDGHGAFRDRTRQWGLADLGITMAMTPQIQDLDGDGWPDLAVAGDVCSSRLYRNLRGRGFTNVTAGAGVGTDENGMGSLIRDLDGDGRPDWLVTAISYPTADGSCPRVSLFDGCSGNRVYLNRGHLRFRDATDELGVRAAGWGWGVAAADFGNDGRTAIAVTNGWAAGSAGSSEQERVYLHEFRADATRMFLPTGAGAYVDVAPQVGIDDRGVGQAAVTFDYDRDGRVDLLVAHDHAAPTLFRNVSTGTGHWLGVALSGPSAGDRDGLGARVDVVTRHGTTTQWVSTSGSYQAQLPATLHVGLGASRAPVTLRVWWPGEAPPQVVRGVQPDRVVVVAHRQVRR